MRGSRAVPGAVAGGQLPRVPHAGPGPRLHGAALRPGDYAYTLRMPNGQVQDVYGMLIKADGWYLKIEIHMDDGQPGIVSCHPAEHDVVTLLGTVPRATGRD